MAEKVVRKTTKKKAVPKKTTKKVVSKTTTVKRKTTTRKKTVAKTPSRKAPTPIASVRSVEKSSNRLVFISIAFFVTVLGISTIIGFSGEGQISIESAIATLKENAPQEERDKIDSVSIQKKNTANVLVPSGVPVEVPASEPVATSTDASASSTDATASSTDAVLEDVVTDENLESDLREDLPQERQEEIIEE